MDKLNVRLMWMAVSGCLVAAWARAETQGWNDAGPDNTWSTDALNWDAGALWVNGNSAVFSGGGGTSFGETVEISNAVTVANITFQTNGYVIADADNNGTLSLAAGPSLISVVNAGDTGTVSEVVGGSGGLTKAGNGQLRLTTNNTYTGTTTVNAGVLRLSYNMVNALGATGTGNDTVVAAGATLDFNGCCANSASSERFTVAGSGVDGKGVLVNTGSGHVNKSVGAVTLSDDAVIGGASRIDTQDIFLNSHTLTKIGGGQLCVHNVATGTIVICAGQYTLLSDNRGLGGTTPGDTIIYGGNLDSWGPHGAVSERIVFNGGYVTQGNPNNQIFTLTGYLTLNSNVTFNTSSPTSGVEVAGYMDGASGFTQANAGWLYITCDTNAYAGPTIINSGRSLWVGKTNLCSGVLGFGAVTNAGTLYGYSARLCNGPLVNTGTLYCNTGAVGACSILNSGTVYLRGGLLGTGSVVNSGTVYCFSQSLGAGDMTNSNRLYFDSTNVACTVSNAVFGSSAGTALLRYGGQLTLSSAFTNGYLRVGIGTLTLTNGAAVGLASSVTVADRQSMNYPVDPTNVTAVVNILDGASLTANCIEMGNGGTVTGGGMTGIVNQAGGAVRTVGWTGDPAHFPGEYDGLRLGHYPQAVSTYNMMGGRLAVGNGYRLAIAVDGSGWFRQTGGEVSADLIIVNARDDGGGKGRLTVEGGVLNVGSNGITAGAGAPYTVEYGGAGGTVRAATNFTSALNATLYGTDAGAITFDTTNWTVTLAGRLTGAGGLNKSGAGDLVLSGTNTFSGSTRILGGTVSPAAAYALSTNSVVAFGVAADGSAGVLRLPSGFSLAAYTVGAVNPELLDEGRDYTVVTWSGDLAGLFGQSALPKPWYVYYDWANKRALLRAAVGTVMVLR